jgi:hypothetical protein
MSMYILHLYLVYWQMFLMTKSKPEYAIKKKYKNFSK